MATQGRPHVKLKVTLAINESGGQWTGFFEGLGITVYGDSEDAVYSRAHGMMAFVIATFRNNFKFEDFCSYLDTHNVQYNVELAAPSPTVMRRSWEEVVSFA